MTKKIILIDARMYGLEHSGIGRYLINLIKELANLKTKEQFVILLRKKYFNSLKLPKNWKKILADFRHYSLLEQIKLPRIIKQNNPNIVHFPHFNVPIFWKGKFIVTIHDMTIHKQGVRATNLPLPAYFFKRYFYKIIFKKAVKDSVKIITPSRAVRNEIARYFKINGNKIVPIYESFDKTYSKDIVKRSILTRNNIKNDYFIYTGNLYPHKNIERLLEAIVLLNKKRKAKVDLILVGSRDIFLDRLKKKAKIIGADKYLKILGFVSDQDLAYLYKKSIGFVYPSLSEGFGLQGLEVMAAGTLLLASDIPVFKEVYQDNPLYFNPYDFSSVEKAMKDALRMNKEKRKTRIKKAKKFIARYSWTKMAEETLKVYDDVLMKC